jgi:hypothetical protein
MSGASYLPTCPAGAGLRGLGLADGPNNLASAGPRRDRGGVWPMVAQPEMIARTATRSCS